MVKIMTYNTHVGIPARSGWHRMATIWKHFMPADDRKETLDKIATLVSEFDLVGLQEADAGSFRTGSINTVKYLSEKAGLSYWRHQVNRFMPHARHSLGLLSRFPIIEARQHKLPGKISGRGMMVVNVDVHGQNLAVCVAHLSLGRTDRIAQVKYIHDVISGLGCPSVLLGDMNTQGDSREFQLISERGFLKPATRDLPSYPSWNPSRGIDHIFVSEGITVKRARALNVVLTDHLPVATEIQIENGSVTAA